MSINELIQNKGTSANECLSVVGDENTLARVADMWKNADLLHLIGTNELIEWTSAEEFDSKELLAFKSGLNAIPKFIEKCYREKLEAVV